MIAWLNGAIVSEPRIDPSDRGFSLGDGMFETLCAAAGMPLYAEMHLQRLHDAAGVLDLLLPYTDDALIAAMKAVLRASALDDAVLRITVTRGPAARGVLPPAQPHPTVLISAGPLPMMPKTARLVIATVTCRNEHSPLSRIKSLNYLDNVLARQEAARRDGDEAVMLNTAGRVADTTTANLFADVDGIIVTPSIAEGALPGISRRRALAALPIIVERALSVDELRGAREIVLTNSLGVRAVTLLDGRAMASGALCERVRDVLQGTGRGR
jgi:branched-chain amino acid aminotransferase